MAYCAARGQLCTVEPIGDRVPTIGEIVLGRMKGNQHLHLAKAIQGERFQIGNNRGASMAGSRAVRSTAD